jgi:hypothetical protein
MTPEFYEGVKAAEVAATKHRIDDAFNQPPYEAGSTQQSDWIKGFSQRINLLEIEEFTDPTQLSPDEAYETYTHDFKDET